MAVGTGGGGRYNGMAVGTGGGAERNCPSKILPTQKIKEFKNNGI